MNWKSVGPGLTGSRNASRKEARKPSGLRSEGRKRKAASSPLSRRRKCSGLLPTGPRPLNHKLPSSMRSGDQSAAIGGVQPIIPHKNPNTPTQPVPSTLHSLPLTLHFQLSVASEAGLRTGGGRGAPLDAGDLSKSESTREARRGKDWVGRRDYGKAGSPCTSKLLPQGQDLSRPTARPLLPRLDHPLDQ